MTGAIYAFVTCPNCGTEKLRVHTIGKQGDDLTDDSIVWQVQYDILKEDWDKAVKKNGSVKCQKCGAPLTLRRPTEEEAIKGLPYAR